MEEVRKEEGCQTVLLMFHYLRLPYMIGVTNWFQYYIIHVLACGVKAVIFM